MIAPEDIVRKAERQYRAVLRAWLAADDRFPMTFPLGKPASDLSARRREIDHLRRRSKEALGHGYALEWETVNQRTLGRQTIPRRAVIADLDDYLALIRKRTEFDAFTADAERIRRRLPALADWLSENPHRVIEHHGAWDDLLTVCRYFIDHPRPNVYIRELPIPVHTKFIEGHTRILRDLLDVLLTPSAIDTGKTEFAARYGLRDKPPLIRLRLLEGQLEWEHDLRLDDLSLPVEQAAHLLGDHLRPRRVIVVENLINFLTLPRLPNAVGIFGGGFGVHLLRGVDWLGQCALWYWGDIDAHGFGILSDLRGIFPHTRSVMMDRLTFDAHADYIVTGVSAADVRLDNLAAAERDLAEHVIAHQLRLEQEHIPHDYAVQALRVL